MKLRVAFLVHLMMYKSVNGTAINAFEVGLKMNLKLHLIKHLELHMIFQDL